MLESKGHTFIQSGFISVVNLHIRVGDFIIPNIVLIKITNHPILKFPQQNSLIPY